MSVGRGGPGDATQADPGQHWRPAADLHSLRLRARWLERIRAYFQREGVWEVDTPILSHAATPDPVLESFKTTYLGPGAPSGCDLYLHTSPEFPMKRLLASGSGSIYQICKVFRNGEAGRLHNPEFSLLEWYREGMDHHALMDDVQALVQFLLQEGPGDVSPENAPRPTERLSYRDLFLGCLDIDPLAASVVELHRCAVKAGIRPPEGLSESDPEPWRDLLLTHAIEPRLPRGLVFVYDYPASQASLARIRPGSSPVAERFELYLDGIELANGFHELTDPVEQRQRFEAEQECRAQLGLPCQALDENFLSALARGMPACSGVALGLDRLFMLAAGQESVRGVIAFPIDRA